MDGHRNAGKAAGGSVQRPELDLRRRVRRERGRGGQQRHQRRRKPTPDHARSPQSFVFVVAPRNYGIELFPATGSSAAAPASATNPPSTVAPLSRSAPISAAGTPASLSTATLSSPMRGACRVIFRAAPFHRLGMPL